MGKRKDKNQLLDALGKYGGGKRRSRRKKSDDWGAIILGRGRRGKNGLNDALQSGSKLLAGKGGKNGLDDAFRSGSRMLGGSGGGRKRVDPASGPVSRVGLPGEAEIEAANTTDDLWDLFRRLGDETATGRFAVETGRGVAVVDLAECELASRQKRFLLLMRYRAIARRAVEFERKQRQMERFINRFGPEKWAQAYERRGTPKAVAYEKYLQGKISRNEFRRITGDDPDKIERQLLRKSSVLRRLALWYARKRGYHK